jgi:threonine-phosphate decarboxylase
LKLKEDKIVDASTGVNPLGPSNKVKAAVRRAIKKINNGSFMKTEGLTRLFESKFRLSPENVLFANSLKELIYLIPDVLNPRRVLIVGPALGVYQDAARAAGAEVLFLNAGEEEDFSVDMSRIRKNSENIDLVFLANPNRISGRMVSRETLREAISVSPSGSPHFVIDESMVEFAESGVCPDDMITHGNVTILRTTAAFYGMPGLELAYAVSSSETINAYRKRKHWEINLLSAEAARTAFKDLTYKKNSLQYLQREKYMIIRMLNKIKWIRVYESDTNILLIKVAHDADEFNQKLRRAGFDIKDCGDIGGLGRSFFRLGVMKHENNLKLIAVLNRFDQSNKTRKVLL